MKTMKRFLWYLIVCFTLIPMSWANDTCVDGSACESTYGLDAETIAQIEIAQVEQLTPNTKLMHDRWYKRIIQRVDVYDAPNGNIIRVLEAGFNFVTVFQDTDGWTQINETEWVKTEFTQDVNGGISSFTGILLPETLSDEYQMGWALVNMYPSPAPEANPSEQFDIIYRYTQLNFFAQVEMPDGLWYQIAPDQWVHQHRIAKTQPLATIPDGVTTDIWVSIDLYEQVLVAYNGERPVFTTLIASGLPRWPTYEGLFNIYYRNPREYMSWGKVGDDFYALEEVPWTMFFDEGRALHGAYWHDGFGYRRSHGCVNMSITDAKWLYDWVAEFMGSKRSADVEVGPAVYVFSSGQYTQ